jgi:nitroreductase
MLTREQQETLLGEVSRAPSVHNVQPARWRFDDDKVTLLHDRSRRLPVADPTGRDVEASLGASFEGMSLALSQLGFGLTEPFHVADRMDHELRLVCTAYFVRGVTANPLAAQVSRRRSWRGELEPIDVRTCSALEAALGQRDDVRFVFGRDEMETVARLNDASSWEFMRDPAYHAELYQWMRLSPTDPRWDVDGLNADCLAMSAAERRAASLFFRPSLFAVLKKMGIARALVAEEPRVRRAPAAIVFHRPDAEPSFESGRAFYRLWLEITAAGLVACPMSSIADSASASAEVRARWRVPNGRRVVNVFRVGKAPLEPPRSPRLSVSDLMVAQDSAGMECVR